LLDSLLQEIRRTKAKMSGRAAWITTLGDMGFGANRAKRALKATSNQGVEQAMEWLLTKSGDESLDDPLSEEEEETPMEEESTEPKLTLKPLTEEEKKEKLARLEELRKKKRAEREERERKEAVEKEKKRVAEGKQIGDLKFTLEQQEMRKVAAEKKREKEADKAAKAKILARIEEDKIARREMFKMKTPEGAAAAAAPAAAASPTPAAAPTPKKDYTECRIQIRQTNGQPLVHSFGAKEELSAVRLYAEINRTDGSAGPVKLMSSFPRKVYTEEDYDNSLENLGLVPSAVLMMTK